ncbi:MAG: hypothetical protein EOM59_16215 [Clostridia bacterium]|nr:hypothetical protein [Clostridia bacterium]
MNNLHDLRKLIEGNSDTQVLPQFDPAAALAASLLDPESIIEKPPTVITIDGISCMTAGSFSLILGRPKARKGFLLVHWSLPQHREGVL